MSPVAEVPESVTRSLLQVLREQGLPTFMSVLLLAFLAWAVYVWNINFEAQVKVEQRQADLLEQMHGEHLSIQNQESRIIDNQTAIIDLQRDIAGVLKANNEARDRQNEILQRLEERSRGR